VRYAGDADFKNLELRRIHSEKVGREIVHCSQARHMRMPIERGATITGAMKSIWIAEGRAAREMTSKTFRPQGE
jgi:hypothetical protein